MFQFLAMTQAGCRRSFPRQLLHRITTQTILVAAVVLPQLIYTQPLPADQASRPNIVLIMADDMGYGDVHALNPESKIPTPNLDRLAAEGMTFSDAHTPSSVCTPTRYGVLTGRYCWRSRLKSGVLNGYGTPLIEETRPTVASFLKANGYTCGIVGKWHLGLDFKKTSDGQSLDFSQPVGGPNELGFDFSYIIPASLDFPPYVYIRNGKVTEPTTAEQKAQKFPAFLRQGPRATDLLMEDVLDHLLEQAQGFVKTQAREKDGKPFFLYFPLTAPHKPVLPHPRFVGKSRLGPYGDFIQQVDWTVGELLNTLDETGVAQNTLVIYTSDNGSFMYRLDSADEPDHVDDETVQAYRASSHRSNYVFRGTKADIWEAGHRVPFFARWPDKIKPGSGCDKTICLTDFFATVADITGAKPLDEAAPDSFSILPLMQGKDWTTLRAPVIHHSVAGMFAIRDGKWKLILGNGSGGRQQPRGKPFAKPYHLFDLSEDISETTNVAGKFPAVVQRLEETCTQIRESGRSR